MRTQKPKKHTARAAKPAAPADPPQAQRSDQDDLPTYDSMLVCAARTGIPIALIKQAKRHGCQAFDVGSRVRLGPLLQWLFSQHAEEAGVDWSNELKKWQAKRQQQFYEQRQGDLLEQDTMTRLLLDVMARQRETLRTRIENEMPMAMAGVDVGSGRVIAKRIVDEVCKDMQTFFETWKDSSAT